MPDVMFEALIVAGLAALLWRRALTPWLTITAGLALGASATARQIGEIFILPAIGYLLIVVPGWRARLKYAALLCVAFALPILAASYGNYANPQLHSFSLAPYASGSIYGRMAEAANCHDPAAPLLRADTLPGRQTEAARAGRPGPQPRLADQGHHDRHPEPRQPPGSAAAMPGKGGRHRRALDVRPGDEQLRPPGAEAAAAEGRGVDSQGHAEDVRADPGHRDGGRAPVPLAIPDLLSDVPPLRRDRQRDARLRHLQPPRRGGDDRDRPGLRRGQPGRGAVARRVPACLSARRRLHPRTIVPVRLARGAGRQPRHAAAPRPARAARRRPGLPALFHHRRRGAAGLRCVRVQLALPASRADHAAPRRGTGHHRRAHPPQTVSWHSRRVTGRRVRGRG